MRTTRVSVLAASGTVEATVLDGGARLLVGGRSVSATEVCFAPPTDGLVYGVALNDQDALHSLGDAVRAPPYQAPPKAPVLYIKPYNTHAGHRAAVPLPAGAEQVEAFGALGIVFGSPASRLSEARALEPVRGYTVVADLSLPQRSLYRPPIREKCFDGACPIGPWVVSRDEIADPDALEVLVHIDGSLRQHHSLRRMVRAVRRLITDVTEFMTLYPGDVLLAGIAAQAPSARAGEAVAVEIPAIGRLECTIESAEGKRR